MQTPFHRTLLGRQSFLLTGHENPDGDCLGAQVALFHLLRQLGKEVRIVNPDPLGRTHDFLQRHTPFDHARSDVPLPGFEVAVLLDCNELSRCGALAERIRERNGVLAVVDHHVGSDRGDGDVRYVDAHAAATGALVYRLYKDLEQPLSAAAAEGVFLSLVADTGWFRYSNADAEVFAMASELVQAGVVPSELYDRLYRRMHPESAAMLARALQQHQLLLDGRLALVALDRALMEHAGHIDFDTDLVIDPLRSLSGVEVVALLKERFDGLVKVSLRAKNDVDVQRIAAALGGGGHKKAAGASVTGRLPAVAEAVVGLVRQALLER